MFFFQNGYSQYAKDENKTTEPYGFIEFQSCAILQFIPKLFQAFQSKN